MFVRFGLETALKLCSIFARKPLIAVPAW
jgi:hypothetical protein